MRRSLWALRTGTPTIWILTALIAVVAAPPAAAASKSRDDSHRLSASWVSASLDRGSPAHPLARGTGYWRGRSKRVRDAQDVLRSLGYAPGPRDGLFGPRTEGAVRRFQAAQRLTVDGIVGPRTLRCLRFAARHASQSRHCPQGRLLARGTGYWRGASERVRQVQRVLRSRGYAPGPRDGVFGPRTEGAVRRFQAAHRLEIDGVVGLATRARFAAQSRRAAGEHGRAENGRARAPNRVGEPPAAPDGTEEPAIASRDRDGFPVALAALPPTVLLLLLLLRSRRRPTAQGCGTRASDSAQGLYGAPTLLSSARLTAGRAASVACLLTGLAYLYWRIETITGTLGVLFWIVEALNFCMLLLSGLLLWPRPRQNRPPQPPFGRLAVVIPVCGEPTEMVERTLRAALEIDYPHATYIGNDGWIAGAPNWQEIEDLAERYGVPCFTRKTGTRAKAGNLNYVLERTDEEFIAVIDADHRAVKEFADETLGYFADETVAFVSTPQQFEHDPDDLFNSREPFFYRCIQPAKDAVNSAFSCGNGAVYRRAALESVRGFSEWNIVEDLHTSYEMHARGWRSVYHPYALTTGLTPETPAGFIKQRLGWATDGLRILFWDNPLVKPGLRAIQRLHYLHVTVYYAVSATQVVFPLAPALYVIWGVSVMRFDSLATYLVWSLPFYLALLAFLAVYSAGSGVVRMISAQTFLLPIYLLAVIRAATGRRSLPGATQKVRPARYSRLLVPALLFFLLLSIGVAEAALGQDARLVVAGLWVGWFAFLFAGPLSALSPKGSIQRFTRWTFRGAVLVALAAAAVPHLSLLPGEESAAGQRAFEVAQRLDIPQRGAYVGVYNPAIQRDPRVLSTWNQHHGVKSRIVNLYQDWFSEEAGFPADRAGLVASRQAVPMITWQPWSARARPQSDGRALFERIVSGAYDAYIRSWARGVAFYRGPVLVRFMHDMNGDWYPWSIGRSAAGKRLFVAAWRYTHDLFTREGAANVSWVWNVHSFAGLRRPHRDILSYYPGDRYVDWVAAAGADWHGAPSPGPRRQIEGLFGPLYAALARLEKPIMISEIATADAAEAGARWVARSLARLRTRYRRVKAVVWFDNHYSKDVDFRLRGQQTAAFDGGVRGRHWRQPLRLARGRPNAAPTVITDLASNPRLRGTGLGRRECGGYVGAAGGTPVSFLVEVEPHDRLQAREPSGAGEHVPDPCRFVAAGSSRRGLGDPYRLWP